MACSCCITFYTNIGALNCQQIKTRTDANLELKIQSTAGYLTKTEIHAIHDLGDTSVLLVSDSGLITIEKFINECECIAGQLQEPLITSVTAIIDENGALSITNISGINLGAQSFQAGWTIDDGVVVNEPGGGDYIDLSMLPHVILSNPTLGTPYKVGVRLFGLFPYTLSNSVTP